jgi:hypothetical protein
MDQDESIREPKNIPFIAYVEGSYFGDTEIFSQNVGNFERDSTAITALESHFFVLSRDVVFQLKEIFEKEFEEMEDLAQRRRKRHSKLIKEL